MVSLLDINRLFIIFLIVSLKVYYLIIVLFHVMIMKYKIIIKLIMEYIVDIVLELIGKVKIREYCSIPFFLTIFLLNARINATMKGRQCYDNS